MKTMTYHVCKAKQNQNAADCPSLQTQTQQSAYVWQWTDKRTPKYCFASHCNLSLVAKYRTMEEERPFNAPQAVVEQSTQNVYLNKSIHTAI